MTRLIVHGAHGRMGQRICALAHSDPRFEIVAALARSTSAGWSASEGRRGDVIVDFSSPEGASLAADHALASGAALLVGTTGLPAGILRKLEDSARSVPVMIAPNTSLGIAVLGHLAVEAARLLGEEFDVDVIESHHAAKRDAPSGTAVRIVATLREGAGIELAPERVHAIRAGDVVGEHTVTFRGPGERLEIFHGATSRDLFARGALRAAAWLGDQPAGRYRIEDALGLG